MQHQLQAKNVEPNLEWRFCSGRQQRWTGIANKDTELKVDQNVNSYQSALSHFTWPVNSNIWQIMKRVCLKDCLRVDIWDFNDEESVNDKFGKINQVGHGTLNNNKYNIIIENIIHQVKDGRGLRKFIKETLHATAGEAQTR